MAATSSFIIIGTIYCLDFCFSSLWDNIIWSGLNRGCGLQVVVAEM